MAKRVYRKNKTKGSRPGRKWPEQVKTAAMCDLLTSNNICDVARRHGVPESTLRTWMHQAEKMDAAGRKSLFVQAREREIRKLNHLAAQSAAASVDFIRRRLEVNDTDAILYYGAQARMDEMDGVSALKESAPGTALAAAKEPESEEDQLHRIAREKEEREKLESIQHRHRPMSDFAATNYLRALTSVTEHSCAMLGDDTDSEDTRLQINFHTYTESTAQAHGTQKIVQSDEEKQK